MKTYAHLWQYLAEFVLEWEMFQERVAEKIRTLILRSVTFYWKSCHLWDNVEIQVHPDKPQITIQHGACISYAG